MRPDPILLLDMLLSARDATSFVADQLYEEFAADRMRQLAVVKAIEVIGEAASRISDDCRNSHQEIPGVWTSVAHRVGGFDLTLDTIEHQLLRGIFKDPRIHFVVNCASRSCAPLYEHAFTGRDLNARMEARTRAFFRNPSRIRLQDGRLLVSRYFDWYPRDFTNPDWHPSAATIEEFIARYADPAVAGFVRHGGKIAYLDYDWKLNGSPPPAASR